MLERAASRSTASVKLRLSIRCTNLMTSPPSAQEKQYHRPRAGVTLNDGVFSSWNGHSPLSEPPPALRSCRYSPMTSSIAERSRTSAMSSSRIRPATFALRSPAFAASLVARPGGLVEYRAAVEGVQGALGLRPGIPHRPHPLAGGQVITVDRGVGLLGPDVGHGAGDRDADVLPGRDRDRPVAGRVGAEHADRAVPDHGHGRLASRGAQLRLSSARLGSQTADDGPAGRVEQVVLAARAGH